MSSKPSSVDNVTREHSLALEEKAGSSAPKRQAEFYLSEDGEWVLRGSMSLYEFAEIEMGQSPKGETCNTKGIGLPLLNGPTEFGVYHPTPSQWTTDARRTAKKGDLLFCVRGSTTGRMNWADQDYAIGRGIAAIKGRSEEYPQRFIRAVIDQNLSVLLQQATGSTFPNVSREQLQNLKCSVFGSKEQKAIAAVLGSLDDKIELLREQNETLEALAQTLFKRWFIDFNFPDENGNPYKDSGGNMIASELGEIPEGWTIDGISSFIKRSSISYRCTQVDLENHGETQIFDQGSSGVYGFTNREPDFDASFEDPVILFTNHTCNYWLVSFPFCAIQNVIPYRGKDGYPIYWLYFATKDKVSFIEYKGHWPDLEAAEFIIPTEQLRSKFNEATKPICKKIFKNSEEVKILTKLRNTLLPKLMKGEIRVPVEA